MIEGEKKRSGFLGQRMVVIPKSVLRDIKKNPIISSIHITDIGYYPHAKYHYRERKEGATEYILIYCLEGHGWIELGSKKYELVPNSYFIVPINEPHKYGSLEKDPWSIYWIHFDGSSAKDFYHKYAHNETSYKQPQVEQIPFEDRRIKYFNGIISLLESGYSKEIIEYVNITLWQLMGSFIYNDLFSKVRHSNNETDIVDIAITYMRESLDRSISVEELADHINYSTSYLYSLFKEKTGYSPIHYFNHLKIQKACQYLSFTNMSIKEISYKLGFNDPFYFSRLFKKLMELSPTAYREDL